MKRFFTVIKKPDTDKALRETLEDTQYTHVSVVAIDRSGDNAEKARRFVHDSSGTIKRIGRTRKLLERLDTVDGETLKDIIIALKETEAELEHILEIQNEIFE